MYNNIDKKDKKNNFIKPGFTSLLKPFEESIKDVEKITKSFGLAIRIHNEIVRKYQSDTDEPQINHSLRVALILSEEIKLNETDLICSALLHDIFNKEEPSQEIKDYIKLEIGEKIYQTVSFFVKKAKKTDEPQTIEKQISKIKQADNYTKCIVLAERLDDLRSLKNSRRKDKIARFKDETQKFFVPLAEKTNEKILLKLIIALYELK
jgi:(p)ppGpp synthase/HD superfamily hydrolase